MIKNVFHPYCEDCPDIKVEADTTVNEVRASMFDPYYGNKNVISKHVDTTITCEHYDRCQHIYECMLNEITKGEQK